VTIEVNENLQGFFMPSAMSQEEFFKALDDEKE
jgi:hypothetical protein